MNKIGRHTCLSTPNGHLAKCLLHVGRHNQYDPSKRARTLVERQLDSEDAKLVFEASNFETEGTRKNYGEKRIICFGRLRDRMVVIGYTPRGGDRHIFSMRKANDCEQALIAPLLGI